MPAVSRGPSSTSATGSDRKIGSAGWPTSGSPTTPSSTARSRSKILHDRFAQDARVRRALPARGRSRPPASSTRTSSASSTAATFDGTYFIAMEYVEGPSLKDLVDGGLTPEATRSTSPARSSSAARFAHRNGIVHRDLKPQNVLIDDEGEPASPTSASPAPASSSITADRLGDGHRRSTSRRSRRRGKPTTPRSDIYSIGVILYEALTGRVPFEGDSAVAVALKQVSEAPRRPSAINPERLPALDAVVMRALAKDPDARFKDADAFLQGPGRRREGPVTRHAPRTPPPTPRSARGETDVPGDRSTTTSEEHWERDRRRRRWRWIIVAARGAASRRWSPIALTRPSHDRRVPDVIGQDVAAGGPRSSTARASMSAIKAVPSGAPAKPGRRAGPDPRPTAAAARPRRARR